MTVVRFIIIFFVVVVKPLGAHMLITNIDYYRFGFVSYLLWLFDDLLTNIEIDCKQILCSSIVKIYKMHKMTIWFLRLVKKCKYEFRFVNIYLFLYVVHRLQVHCSVMSKASL